MGSYQNELRRLKKENESLSLEKDYYRNQAHMLLEIKTMRNQNEYLKNKVKEYKTTCDNIIKELEETDENNIS